MEDRERSDRVCPTAASDIRTEAGARRPLVPAFPPFDRGRQIGALKAALRNASASGRPHDFGPFAHEFRAMVEGVRIAGPSRRLQEPAQQCAAASRRGADEVALAHSSAATLPSELALHFEPGLLRFGELGADFGVLLLPVGGLRGARARRAWDRRAWFRPASGPGSAIRPRGRRGRPAPPAARA